MNEHPPKTLPPLVPWQKIFGLAALGAPPILLAHVAGLPLAAATIGLMTGFLAALAGGTAWALAAVGLASVAFGLTAVLPGEGIYVTALLLCLTVFAATIFGGGRALTYGIVGWVFLALYDFGPADDLGPLAIFIVAGLWAVPSAYWLSVSGLIAPKPPFTAIPWPIATVITIGFLLSLVLADAVDMDRPYWVPFVFLQVIAASGLAGPHAALRRLLGAVLGVVAVTLLLPPETPIWITLPLSGLALALALRFLRAYPIIARGLTTAGILLVLTPVDASAADARLLAEALGVAVLVVTAVLVSFLSAADDRTG